jgi:cobalt-zinc-cadmium efflux system outer membrane protein
MSHRYFALTALATITSVGKMIVSGGDACSAADAPALPIGEQSVLSDALNKRSDVLSAVHGERQAQAALDLARRTRVPPVSLWASYAIQGSGPNATTPPTLTVGLEAPLPIFYQNQGEIMKTESTLFAQQVRRAKVGSQVVDDVSPALASLDISRKRLARMNDSLLDRACRRRQAQSGKTTRACRRSRGISVRP